MAHHAYLAAGERAATIAAARHFSEHAFGEASLEIVYLSFELFTVDDARRLIHTASMSGVGGSRVIIASMTRIFHEAQNALLKIVEEPPEGTVIILCAPSEGIFIPTLRSRLLSIPTALEQDHGSAKGIAGTFLATSAAGREKIVAQLVERAKSDKEEAKQQARRDAIELLQGLTKAAYAHLHATRIPGAQKEARLFLEDLSSFLPILYERSAPLKLIFEHLLLVLPKGLTNAEV